MQNDQVFLLYRLTHVCVLLLHMYISELYNSDEIVAV